MIIAAVALAAAFESFTINRQLARRSSDPFGVGAALLRFESAKQRIPKGTPVGYLSDLPPGIRATLAFLLAQCALAPLPLIRLPADPAVDLVIADVTQPQRVAELAETHGLRVAEDLGHGVYFLHRKP